MSPLTYRELLAALYELTEEQLDMSASVVGEDGEVAPIFETYLASELPTMYGEPLLETVVESQQPLMLTFVTRD